LKALKVRTELKGGRLKSYLPYITITFQSIKNTARVARLVEVGYSQE